MGWIKANSKKLNLDSSFKVPHMGWNYVAGKKSLISEDLNEQARFYFVHSYHMVCQNEEDVLFRTNYGFNFTSGICKENIYGVQFHPEFSWEIIKMYVSIRSGMGMTVDDPSIPESSQGELVLFNFIGKLSTLLLTKAPQLRRIVHSLHLGKKFVQTNLPKSIMA